METIFFSNLSLNFKNSIHGYIAYNMRIIRAIIDLKSNSN